ncbi:MAG: hypothetical protein N2749_02410 [Clostridia bacterium]|nr:hypothetical protein [Clostridia bacterium]
MKKVMKMLVKILPVFIVAVLIIGNVYGISANLPNTIGGNEVTEVTNLVGTIWKTLSVVIQIAAIAAIVIAGLRYMFASADTKADIKQQTIILVVGAALVFAAVPIAQLISNASKNIFK